MALTFKRAAAHIFLPEVRVTLRMWGIPNRTSDL